MAGDERWAGLAASILTASAWFADPAALAALASLLTAVAAYRRVRLQRQSATPPAQLQDEQMNQAHAALYEAERTLRTELLRQLDHLRAQVDRLEQDLGRLRTAAKGLEHAVVHCPIASCPIRAIL